MECHQRFFYCNETTSWLARGDYTENIETRWVSENMSRTTTENFNLAETIKQSTSFKSMKYIKNTSIVLYFTCL